MQSRPRLVLVSPAAGLVLALALFAPDVAHPGSGAWTSSGPPGSYFTAVVPHRTSQGTWFAAAIGPGVVRSTDGCVSWSTSSVGMTDTGVVDLAAAPSNPAVMYAGTYNLVYRSTNAGASWETASGGLPPTVYVSALAVDPGTSATVYVASEYGGVFKTTDSGQSWAPSSAGLGGTTVRHLAIPTGTPSVLYAGAAGPGVFKSTDSGGSWAPAAAGLGSLAVNVVVVDPAQPARLYAGTGSAGVFKSTDGGGSWAATGAGLGDPAVETLALDPLAPGGLYAGTRWSGVFRSTDAGASWTPAGVGLSNPRVAALAIDPLDSTHLCLVNRWGFGGTFRSTDSGASWSVTQLGLGQLWVTALARDPGNPALLYAGTSDPGGGESLRSTDSGATWAPTRSSGPPFYVAFQALVVDPSSPGTVYAATEAGVFKSTDSGGMWQSASLGLPSPVPDVRALALDPATPATLYAGTWGYGVFKSTDAGGSWAPANANLPGNLLVWSLAVDPAVPSRVYAGSADLGAFRSTDAGATWGPAGPGLGSPVRALVVDPSDSTRVYAANAGMVARSTDAGASWSQSVVSAFTVQALAVDASATTRLYAGTYDGFVYHSTDAGASWRPGPRSWPPVREVRALVVDPSGPTVVHAGLLGASVWQLSPAPPKGDIDRNGSPDLYFRSAAGGTRNKVWLMNGVVRTAEADLTPDAAGPEWQLKAVDDFDVDGHADLLFWNELTGQVDFWFMNGTSRRGQPVPLAGAPVLPLNWEVSAAADFSHDGRPDLVWRNHTSQKIVIWTMNGATKSGAIVPVPGQAADPNWSIVAAQDYDGDFEKDFLWYNTNSGKIVIWYMDANVARRSGQFTSPSAAGDANWKVLASGDYSGSAGPGVPPAGVPDLVWRNATSGKQVVWHMDAGGSRVYGEFTVPAANSPPLDWVLVGPR